MLRKPSPGAVAPRVRPSLVCMAVAACATPASAMSQSASMRDFTFGLTFVIVLATVLGIAIGLLGNPRERWMRGAIVGGATGLGSMLLVLLVLTVLIRSA
jgi:hypothetical protein